MFFNYILRKLFTTAVTLLGVAFIVFVVIRISPGDPIALLIGPGATEADIANLRVLYGLDKSVIHQFFIWLGNVVQGDFGTSFTMRQDVLGIILSRLPATLELCIFALIIAVTIGVNYAVVSVLYQKTRAEGVLDAIKGIVLAVPDFLWGLVLILLFGVFFAIFPISGRINPQLELNFFTEFYIVESILRFRFDVLGNLLTHMIMPGIALALPLAAMIAHLLKQSLKEELLRDYATLSVTRGFSDFRIIMREVMPNAVLPTLTLTGFQFSFLLGNTVIVEKLFSYEGLGNLAIDAVVNRDFPLIQGIILLFSVLFISINLIVDFLYIFLDPKLRRANR